MARQTTIVFGTTMRARWPRPLASEWVKTYPEVFDRHDLRLALSQPRSHFYEWFAAIHLFHRDGALSLIEKYGHSNHERKGHRLESVLGAQDAEFVRTLRRTHGVQPPDLFVYIPKSTRYWFAEIKGPTDRLSERQVASHAAIRARLGVETEFISVRAAPRLRAP